MAEIKLRHVREFQGGDADSFAVGSAKLSSESVRLLGDLALLTREFSDTKSGVEFDEVERLANEAFALIISRVDFFAKQMGIAEPPGKSALWFPWFDDNEGLLRRPTRNEVVNFEGESRLLYDALGESKSISYFEGVRLTAAFGVYCVERALDAETRSHIGTIIEMYAAAGVLLGHANYFLGCVTAQGAVTDGISKTRREGAKLRWERDPKSLAMMKVQALWLAMVAGKSRHRTDADFARDMMREFGSLLTEGGIKNRITKWRKAGESSC